MVGSCLYEKRLCLPSLNKLWEIKWQDTYMAGVFSLSLSGCILPLTIITYPKHTLCLRRLFLPWSHDTQKEAWRPFIPIDTGGWRTASCKAGHSAPLNPNSTTTPS